MIQAAPAPLKIPAAFEQEHVVAVVDTREQLPLDLAPMQVVRDTLPTGDYSVRGLEQHVAIERKELGDLLSCVGVDRARFDREIQRMLTYPTRALIVEASWADIEAGGWRSKVTPSAALGSLLGWTCRGLPVVMAGNRDRAALFVRRILFIAARRRWREARAFVNGIPRGK